MKAIDFCRLRDLIHEHFSIWFSYSSKHNCLHCSRKLDHAEEKSLVRFLSPDFILFSTPSDYFIISKK